MQALREYSEKDKGFFMRLAELQSQMEVMLPKIEDNDPDVKEALEALETKLMSSKVDLRMIKFNCIGSRCKKKGPMNWKPFLSCR